MLQRTVVVGAVFCLLLSCGSESPVRQQEGSTGPDGYLVDVSLDGEVVPSGGSAVGGGHVVLYGSYGIARDGSGDLWRATKVLDLDLASGERRWIDLPPGFVVGQAVATPEGLLVLGGACMHGDVIAIGEVDGISCPDQVTDSYRMEWGSNDWSTVFFDDSLEDEEGFPYVDDGGLLGFDDTVYLMLRTSSGSSSLFVNQGEDTWSNIGDYSESAYAPCATTDGLILLENTLDREEVEEFQLRRISIDGSTHDLPLPEGLPRDSFGGISTRLGCLSDGPVLLYGGASPLDGTPVSVKLLLGDVWAEVQGEFAVDSAGGLPSGVLSNHGSITFELGVLSAEGVVDRTAYLISDRDRGIALIDSIEKVSEGSAMADPRLVYDPTTETIVEIRFNRDSTTIAWS